MAKHESTLGQLLDETAHRDAVHVAIEPCVAPCKLIPGEKVDRYGFPKCNRNYNGQPVGIVDPFLADLVQPGQKFWICLLPGSVTSLRHYWQSEAFKAGG